MHVLPATLSENVTIGNKIKMIKEQFNRFLVSRYLRTRKHVLGELKQIHILSVKQFIFVSVTYGVYL